MHAEPHEPADETGDFHLAHLHYRVEAVDDGHRALVKVVERVAVLRSDVVFDLLLDDLAHVLTGLDSHLCNTREAVAVHHVADDEDVRIVAHREIGVDRHLAGAISFGAELLRHLLAQRGSGHTGGPDLRRGVDGGFLFRLHVLVGHGVRVHVGHHGVENDGHAGLFQLTLRLLAQALAKGRQHLRRTVEQVDLSLLGAKGVPARGERAVRHLRHLAS